MWRRRPKRPVLAELPARRGAPRRAGALGRAELAAFAGLAEALSAHRAVLAIGPERSAVALGLAAAATADGRRAALLECDLAAPALAATLGLEPSPGLGEYLREEAETSEILQPLVLAGPASGRATEPLACVVAGEPVAAPAALIDSERCDRAIAGLGRVYELLVIAGPALDEDADALQALAEHAGATIACGAPREIPRRLPVAVEGLVAVG